MDAETLWLTLVDSHTLMLVEIPLSKRMEWFALLGNLAKTTVPEAVHLHVELRGEDEALHQT